MQPGSVPNSAQAPADPAFDELSQAAGENGEVPLAMLLDLTLPVSIELGRTNMTVQEVLRLGRGSVVQLDRLAGEPIDIYVGDRRFAEGEVVVLGEHFGIRITRIISRQPIGENAA
jgi:flagellar motor switch protein FliN/FliY